MVPVPYDITYGELFEQLKLLLETDPRYENMHLWAEQTIAESANERTFEPQIVKAITVMFPLENAS